MPGTGEVITFAEGSVDFAELRLVAQALLTAALSPAAAHLLALSFTAGAEVLVVDLALLAFAARSEVAGLAAAHPAAVGAGGAAAATVDRRVMRAAAIAVVIHRDLQTVFEADRPDGETLPGAFRGASSCIDGDVEGDLKDKTTCNYYILHTTILHNIYKSLQ